MDITIVEAGDTDEKRQAILRATEVLQSGGLVVFPTETVYGIAASATSSRGIDALRQYKNRSEKQPFTMHLSSATVANRYVDNSDKALQRLIRKAFPGPITLVVDVPESVQDRVLEETNRPPEMKRRLYHRGTIGLRCPDSRIAQEILKAVDEPIVASSANTRCQSPPRNAEEAAASVGDVAQMIVDGGPCRFAKPSTIVRVTGSGEGLNVIIERAGVYDERFVGKLLRWTMIVVCSGNTCRSPMAEGIAKHLLARQKGVSVDKLEAANIYIGSAGTFAAAGMLASPEAVQELREIDVDLSSHRSRPLTAELINQADVCYCMTQAHLQAAIGMAPWAASKIQMLDPDAEVEDPIGLDQTGYRQCAQRISHLLEQRLKEQQL